MFLETRGEQMLKKLDTAARKNKSRTERSRPLSQLAFMLASLLTACVTSEETYCFGGTFPKLFRSTLNTEASALISIASTPALDAIFVGGWTKDKDLIAAGSNFSRAVVVLRISLVTEQYEWSKQPGFNGQVDALAVNLAGTRVAVYGSKDSAGIAYLYLLDAATGDLATSSVPKINSNHDYQVKSTGLHLSNTNDVGVVYNDLTANTMRFASFRFNEAQNNFIVTSQFAYDAARGRSIAVTTNYFYIGGAIQFSQTNLDLVPAIWKVSRSSNFFESLWKLGDSTSSQQIGSSYIIQQNVDYVQHLQIDEQRSLIYGATGSDNGYIGYQSHTLVVFRIEVASNGMLAIEIPDQSLAIRGVRVVTDGGTEMHIIAGRESNKQVYYLIVDLASRSMVEIKLAEQSMFAREAIFFGAQSEQIFGKTLYRGFVVGMLDADIQTSRGLIETNFLTGFVLQTLSGDSGCLKYPGSISDSTIPPVGQSAKVLFRDIVAIKDYNKKLADLSITSSNTNIYQIAPAYFFESNYCQPVLTLSPPSFRSQVLTQWGKSLSVPATPAAVLSPDCLDSIEWLYTFTDSQNSELLSFATKSDATGFFFDIAASALGSGTHTFRVTYQVKIKGYWRKSQSGGGRRFLQYSDNQIDGAGQGGGSFDVYIYDDLCAQRQQITQISVENHNYVVGDQLGAYGVGLYIFDLQEQCPCTQQIVGNGPSDVFTIVDEKKITWFTTNPAKSGTYNFSVILVRAGTTVASNSFTVTLVIDCERQTVTAPVVTDKNYKVADPSVQFTVPEFGNNYAPSCPLTYIVTHPTSSWLTSNGIALSWFTAQNADAAIHKVTVSAVSSAGTIKAQSIFYITVTLNCKSQLIAAPQLTNQVYKTMTGPASYDTPAFTSNDPYCGISYSLIYDATKAFMTPRDSRSMKWDSSSNQDIGVYTIQVRASGPEGASAEASYTLTVVRNCINQRIFAPSAANKTYKVRAEGASQELAEFTTDEAVHCPLTYQTVVTPTSTFITTLSSMRGVAWVTQTNTDVGLYTIRTTATGPEGVALTQSFTLTVQPDCSKQVLTASQPTNKAYAVGDGRASYVVPAFANDETLHCAPVYALTIAPTPAADFVKAGSAERELTWLTGKNTDSGVYTVTCRATGPEGVTASATFTLTVSPTCLYQVLTPPTVAAQHYQVRDPEVIFSVAEFGNSEAAYCPLTYAVSLPSGLSWLSAVDGRTGSVDGLTVRWQTNSNADSGSYSITVTATGTQGVSKAMTYALIVRPDCSKMIVVKPTVIDQSYKINAPAASYEVGVFENDESVFCALTYSISTTLGSKTFLTSTGARQVQWYSTKNADTGSYSVKVLASCAQGMSWEVSFTLTVTPDCSVQVLSPPQVVNQVYVVNDPAAFYRIPEFSNSDPVLCPSVYTVQFDSSKSWLTWAAQGDTRRMDWHTSDNAQYGAYVITFTATGPENVSSRVSWTLTLQRQCQDANLRMKFTAFPAAILYTLEDPALKKTFAPSNVISDQTATQCPHRIVFDMLFNNGTALNGDTFSWDAKTFEFSVYTADYQRYYKDNLYTFAIFAHYETYPRDSGDKLLTTVQLKINCDLLPQDPPSIQDVNFIIGQSGNVIDFELGSTFCGPWVIDASKVEYTKNLSWCSWCIYLNSGLFAWDAASSNKLIINPTSAGDTGQYVINVPLVIPGTSKTVIVSFKVTISYCKPDTLTPVAVDKKFYSLAGEKMIIDVSPFTMVPACQYDLIYSWKYKSPDTGLNVTMPAPFVKNGLNGLTVYTTNQTFVGSHTLVLKGNVNPLFITPLKIETWLEVQIQIDYPCPSTVISKDLDFDPVFAVPLGSTEHVRAYSVPNDSVSLQYGTGKDKCGPRLVELTDSAGAALKLSNFAFKMTVADSFEFKLTSFAEAGIDHEQAIKVKVSLQNYPMVTPQYYQLTLKWREQPPQPTPETTPQPSPLPEPSPTPVPVPVPVPVPAPEPAPVPVPVPVPVPAPEPSPETTPTPAPKPQPSPLPESVKDPSSVVVEPVDEVTVKKNSTDFGIEVFPFDRKPVLDPVIHSGFATVTHHLTEVKNSVGRTHPMYIELPKEVSEFATYFSENSTIFIDKSRLKPEHQGTYELAVMLGYGFGTAEKLYGPVPVQLIVKDLIQDEVITDPASEDQPVEPKPEQPRIADPPFIGFQPGTFTPQGVRIPETKILKISEFEVKKTIDPARTTGREPKPKLRSVDETGMLTIDWDQAMVKPLDLKQIKSTSYAVLEESASGKRKLARRREWFNTDEQYLKYLLVIDALELQITAMFDDGSDSQVPFTWDLVSFEDRENQIQLYFREKDLQVTMTQKNLVTVTFWGTEFFRSLSNEEVRYGETIDSYIRWNTVIDPEALSGTSGLASFATILTSLCVLSVPILAALQSSILSVWIMMVSLQLIAHMLLINSLMPAEVILFLRQILGFMRVVFTTDQEGSNQPFNAIFQRAGYLETGLSGNFSIAFSVTLPALLGISLSMILFDFLARKQGWKPPEWFKNLIPRVLTFTMFFYSFCLLELYICALVEIRAEGSGLPWFALIAVTAPFFYLATMFWKWHERFGETQAGMLELPLDDSFHPTKGAGSDLESQSLQAAPEKEQSFGVAQLQGTAAKERLLMEPTKNIALTENNENRALVDESASNGIIMRVETPEQHQECFEGGSSRFTLLERIETLRPVARQTVQWEAHEKSKSQRTHSVFFGRKITKKAIVFNIAFALRAFIFSLAVVFCDELFFPLQILLILVSTTIFLGVALDAGKDLWIDPLVRYQHTINEFTVCTATVFHFLFSDYVDSFDARQTMGTVLIALIFGAVLVNFGFVVAHVAIAVRDRVRRHRARLAKLRQEHELLSKTENALLNACETKQAFKNELQEAEPEDALQYSLRKRQISARVAPAPVPEAAVSQEASLNSFRPEEQKQELDLEEEEEQKEVCADRNSVEEGEIKGVVYNIDDLEDLQCDVSLDVEQPGIACRMDDSQDVSIVMDNKFTPRNFETPQDMDLSQQRSLINGDSIKSQQKEGASQQSGLVSGIFEAGKNEAPTATDHFNLFEKSLETGDAGFSFEFGRPTNDVEDEAGDPVFQLKIDQNESFRSRSADSRAANDLASAPAAQSEPFSIAPEFNIGLVDDLDKIVDEEAAPDSFEAAQLAYLQMMKNKGNRNYSFFQKLDDLEKTIQEDQQREDQVLETIVGELTHEAQKDVEGELQDRGGFRSAAFGFDGLDDLELDKGPAKNDRTDGGERGASSDGFDPDFSPGGQDLDGTERVQRAGGMSLTVGEGKSREKPEGDTVTPKKQLKAAKWATSKGRHISLTKTAVNILQLAKPNPNTDSMTQKTKTQTAQLDKKADSKETKKKNASKNKSQKGLIEASFDAQSRISGTHNQQPFSARQKESSAKKIGKQLSLRNRSQGELILEKPQTLTGFNRLNKRASVQLDDDDSEKQDLTLHLLQVNNPRFSQKEISLFKDSSAGVYVEDESASEMGVSGQNMAIKQNFGNYLNFLPQKPREEEIDDDAESQRNHLAESEDPDHATEMPF